jgi:methylmalonyl-CoA/ethylmalonyl-CoA epimerase
MTETIPALDHVAIAVHNLDEAIAYYVDVLGFAPPEIETVVEQQVTTAIFGHGRGRIELICPTQLDSPVGRFLEKRGQGLHHVCIEVADIGKSLQNLAAKGAQLIDTTPKTGAGGAKIAFVHPKGALGVLTELRQGPAPATKP